MQKLKFPNSLYAIFVGRHSCVVSDIVPLSAALQSVLDNSVSCVSQDHGNSGSAAEYLKGLQQSERYQRDVWF